MEKITSFTIDHIKLQPGLYVSRKDTQNGVCVTTFDLRVTSPNEEPVMNTAEVHTIEHLMAYYLRLDEQIGASIVSFCPMGCQTGFYLSTMNDITAEDIKEALGNVYKKVFPIASTDDIVGLNEIQCGNPRLYAIEETNEAMSNYIKVLYGTTEI